MSFSRRDEGTAAAVPFFWNFSEAAMHRPWATIVHRLSAAPSGAALGRQGVPRMHRFLSGFLALLAAGGAEILAELYGRPVKL